MCQKSCQVFKQFYAVILVNAVSPSRSLQVFKLPPTKAQVDTLIAREVIGKVEPTPFIYSEKPKIEIVPIHIPVDILYH